MPQEIELKLALPRGAVARLRRHPVIAACPALGRAVTLDNIYYDTTDLALKACKIAVRTRRQGRKWLQTVKAGRVSTGGLSARPEWEQAFSGSFDFSAIDDASVRKLLMRHGDRLVPVFSTRFRRETRVFEPGHGVRILIMIDTGAVHAGERSEPICEVELELETGTAHDLLQLATRLATDIPLLPDDASKAERGYRLHLGLVPQPARAEESAIAAAMTPLEAFRELAFACLRQWQANVAGGLTRDGPEFIHQLRVSQRRLRSLMRVFAPALPPAFVIEWTARLRDNANRFGEARDLDVLEDELLRPVHGVTAREEALLGRLRSKVEDERLVARARALEELDAAEQGRLLLEFTTALHVLPSNDLIGTVDLPAFAALQLERLRSKTRKRLRKARDLVPEHLHALRIAFKRLRYGTEFFAPLLPGKTTTRYLSELARLQSALGFINDVDVARVRFSIWAIDDAEMREAVAYVCGWHGPRYQRLSARAVRAAAPLVSARSPWQALRRNKRQPPKA